MEQPAESTTSQMAEQESLLWSPKQVVLLLQHPERILAHQQLGQWVRRRGGLDTVDQYLRTCPRLSSRQGAMLAAILDKPQASAAEYARLLGIDRSRFFPQRAKLCTLLAEYLNSWDDALALGVSQSQAVAQRQLPPPPEPLTRLVGRADELSRICQHLSEPDVRLLSLTGPGGVGKTRLALEVARALSTGFNEVGFISLAAIGDAGLVPSAIAQALGVIEGAAGLVELLKARLRGPTRLLVLDNFEQVIDAAPLLSELLSGAPLLTLLVTSRQRLGLYGEREYHLPPLTLPADGRHTGTELLRAEAVELFVERARAANARFAPDLAALREISSLCRRLDGLPLAIELVAVRSKFFSPAALLARLGECLALNGALRDLPERQRTLSQTIGWSYRLLSAPEQHLFARLGIFAGSWSAEVAGLVCGEQGESPVSLLPLLLSLVDKNLLCLASGPGGEQRFIMLETIRDYALQQLHATGEFALMARRQRDWLVALAEQAKSAQLGPDGPSWHNRLELEHDQIRAALAWSLAEPAEREGGLSLAALISSFWNVRGFISEGRRWLDQYLAVTSEPSLSRAEALLRAGSLAWRQSDYIRSIDLAEQCLSCCRQLGQDALSGWALSLMAGNALHLGKVDQALGFAEQGLALFRQTGHQRGIAHLLLNGLGTIAWSQGDYARAGELAQASLSCYREIEDEASAAWAILRLGEVAAMTGRPEEALAHYEQSLASLRRHGDKAGIGWALLRMAQQRQRQGQGLASSTLLAETLDLAYELGYQDQLAVALVASARGCLEADPQRAALLCGAAYAIIERISAPRQGADLEQPGAPLQVGDHAEHRQVMQQASAALGPERAQAAWQAGRLLNGDEVLARAHEALGRQQPI